MESGPASPSHDNSTPKINPPQTSHSSVSLVLGFVTSAPWPLLIGCATAAALAISAVVAAIFAMCMISLAGIVSLAIVVRAAARDPAFDRRAFTPLSSEEVSRTRKLAKTELQSKWSMISKSGVAKSIITGFADIVKMLTGLDVVPFVEMPFPGPESAESHPENVSGWVHKFFDEDMVPYESLKKREGSSLSFDSKDFDKENGSQTESRSRRSELDHLVEKKRTSSRSTAVIYKDKKASNTEIDFTPDFGDDDALTDMKMTDSYPFPGMPRSASRLMGSTRLNETIGKRLVIPFETKSNASKLTVVKDESRYLEILKLLPVIPAEEAISISPTITLTEFLSVPEIRDDFRSFMQKKLCAENMDFIDAVDLYKNLTPDKRSGAAKNIYETFILPTGSKCVNIDGETIADLAERMKVSSFTEDLFSKAYEVIIRVMEQDVFIQYKSNKSFDPTLRKVIRQVLKKARAPRLEGWVNSEKYVSLLVNVEKISGVNLGATITGKERISFSITVDSTCVTSEMVKPNSDRQPNCFSATFKEPMKFQIASTTQYMEIEVFESISKRFLGRLFVPLLYVVRSKFASQEYELVPSPRTSTEEEVSGKITLLMHLTATFSADSPTAALVRKKASSTAGPGIGHLLKTTGQSGSRFMDNGFDLDLTYVTEHLIAMAEPGQRLNSIDELARFFELRHSNCFKIFGLGQKKPGDAKLDFHIELLPVAEKAPAAFNMILEFCRQVDSWLNAFPQNVVAVYCKTGKGRTGMMICSYLLYSGRCATADQAIELFNQVRCSGSKGLVRPGHTQYIRYIEHYLKVVRELGPSLFPESKRLHVTTLNILRAPVMLRNSLQGMFVEFFQKDGFYTSLKNETPVLKDDTIILKFAKPVPISEDVTLRMHVTRLFRKEHFLSLYFNTRFIEENTLILEKEIEFHNKKEISDKNWVNPVVVLEILHSAKSEQKEFLADLSPLAQSPDVGPPSPMERDATPSISTASSFSKTLRHFGSLTKDEEGGNGSKRRKKSTVPAMFETMQGSDSENE